MSREELLAEAKKRYPVGTKFESVYSGRTFTIKNQDHWTQGDYVRTEVQGSSPYLYRDGVWSRVISKGEPQIINNYEIY